MKYIINFLLLACCSSSFALSLDQCGRVIAHENGIFDFPPPKYCPNLETCPQQFDAILKYNERKPINKQIHFTKISIRTLNDGSWVVAHEQIQYVKMPSVLAKNIHLLPGAIKVIEDTKEMPYQIEKGFKIVSVDLSKIDSAQFDFYRKYNIGVYRLSEYVSHDRKAELCYMLYFKTSPNENIIKEIDGLAINQRTILETNDNEEAAWIHNHQGSTSDGIWFAGRVSTPSNLDALLENAKSYTKMWAIEVNNNSNTEKLVKKINTTTSYVTEVDSMGYDKLKELFKSYCKVPLKEVGSKLTMTSRPADCLENRI